MADSTNHQPQSSSAVLLAACLALILLVLASQARAASPNHLYRIDIRPHQGFTRIAIRLAEPPQYTLSSVPGGRLRLAVQDADGPLLKRFRRYSDPNIGGLVVTRRGSQLLVTLRIAARAGWRDLSRPGVSAITVDVGPAFKAPPARPAIAEREKIWNGVEKLVRDFDPPLKSEIPFTPTDREILKNFLDEGEQKAFMAAEAALYKGRLSEAEELLTQFAARQAPVRPLALYRLAETWYKLQKYPQALTAFREAERLWPAYLGFNPGVTFYYGDSIARSGDLPTARILLAGLVARLADKKYAPALLVRLGDILSRQGHEQEALSIYQNVSENFSDNKASQMAVMRRADREFLQTTPWNYRPLADVYQQASRQSGDIDMREEAHFKYVLLESIHGDAAEALQLVTTFQRSFPRGVYAAVTRTIREVLVASVYQHTVWDTDPAALVRFIEEQHDYLADCVAQPAFVKTIVQAYNASGRPIELVKLMTLLVERVWATPLVPDMYAVIAENAELIGDHTAAEQALTAFLRKFPAHARSGEMKEQLGALYFNADKHQQVKETLSGLLAKGAHAHQQESYYRLGRSLLALQQFAQAARAMDLFLAESGGHDPRLVPDAYFVAASARESLGDRAGALKLLETALRLPGNKRSEEFIYKTGQIYLRDGKPQKARAIFEQLVKTGKDPDWQNLARQALASH